MIDNEIAPNGALLQINRFCNLGCSHCSQSAPRVDRTANLAELSFDHWEEILAKLVTTGITRVRFTGGEPFLRRDLKELATKAQEMGLQVSFVTNGLSLLSRHVSWLADLRPASIWISIYGFPESNYEAISGRPRSFSRVTRTVATLIERNLAVGLYYPAGDQNYYVIGEFIRFFYGLGVRLIKVLQVLPHGRAARAGGLSSLPDGALERTLDMTAEALKYCPQLKIKVSMQSGQSELFRSRGFTVPEDRSCQIGLQNLWTIESTGSVLPCCLFLNKGTGLFDATSPEEFAGWRRWNRAESLRLLGTDAEEVTSCPALPGSKTTSEIRTEEFICPLTFAEMEG